MGVPGAGGMGGLDLPLINGDTDVIMAGGTASTLHSAYNVICSVVGAGILQLPRGVASSGWVGIGILIVLCIFACYTGLRIVDCMELDRTRFKGYGDIGEAAFGKFGRWAVNVSIHVTLVGVATVYLVLAGGNVNSLLPHTFSLREAVLLCAAVVWFHVFLKTLREVGLLSAFNVLVALALFVVVLVEALRNRPVPHPATEVLVWDVSLGTSFAAFSFSYGVHPILPSVYTSMAKPHQYRTMLIVTFAAVLVFYIPMSAVGYAVYGDSVDSVIYKNLPQGIAVKVIIVAVTVHVLCSYAIIISPSEQAVEAFFRTEERASPLLWRVCLRTVIVACTCGIAVAMANVFGPLLDLVSSVTSSFTVFIFPCAIYLRLFKDKVSLLDYLWNGLIIFIAFAGCGFGSYSAIKEIAADVF